MNWVTSSALINRAKKEAKICLETGETIRGVPFGRFEGLIFVSSDPDKVIATESFKEGGKDFFIGTLKERDE